MRDYQVEFLAIQNKLSELFEDIVYTIDGLEEVQEKYRMLIVTGKLFYTQFICIQ